MKMIFITLLVMGPGLILWSRGSGEESVPLGAMEREKFEIREALPDWQKNFSESEVEKAVLAGGCFWGVEAVFEQLEGVLDVDSGYSGGAADTAFYKEVGSGETGHAEAVEIVYDPELISYETLLEVFFTVAHDPTQYNYQGPDVGTEYRSVVFYQGEEQRRAAKEMIDRLAREKTYEEPIVTQVVPLEAFYPAEEYHQDFLRLNPGHGYIVYWDLPKIEHLRETYPELIFQ